MTYSYAVNGASFSSQRISFAGGYKPKETNAILARYPAGKEVPVSYSPENPAEATLETGATKQVRAQLNILVILFVVIVLLNVVTYFVRSTEMGRPPVRTYGATRMVANPV